MSNKKEANCQLNFDKRQLRDNFLQELVSYELFCLLPVINLFSQVAIFALVVVIVVAVVNAVVVTKELKQCNILLLCFKYNKKKPFVCLFCQTFLFRSNSLFFAKNFYFPNLCVQLKSRGIKCLFYGTKYNLLENLASTLNQK